MILESTAEDLVYTAEVSGIPANWLKKSLEKVQITKPTTISNVMEDAQIEKEYKRWRDIWSAGQGITQIKTIKPTRQIIEEMISEYKEIVKNLPKVGGC